MIDQRPMTAAEVLDAVRRRRPVCDRAAVNDPVTAAQILAAFEAKMQHRSDIGLANRALNIFLEPRNPFEPGRRRKPKMETVLFGMLLCALITAVLFFNLAAPRVQVQP